MNWDNGNLNKHGLKGSEREIAGAFEGVDTNNSGLVDLDEFKNAIKGERMAELSLGSLLEKMGVQLRNRDGAYDSFKATVQRRRLMKKKYEEDTHLMTRQIIGTLSKLTKRDIPGADPEKEKV